ncbi:MAG: hypothetical protein E5X49_17090 [Mesorhizobium sp.]|uniref:hypothetical protein n=1 Tax=unclassified Mesorhizobium TaxID=325217 RepID=UPI001210A696|nr:hypothetical protein [Mesorhizobium sp.]TIQ41852.1 MAG: hypothetical protein E5X49_17090 [Mesorhizobium sp.]
MTYALFQMWGQFRQSLIRGHLFYVEQARKRLLSQFDNNEADADQAAEEWLEESGRYFDPDRHDEGSFYEAANDVRIEFYGLLSDMRENTRLSVVAGMFHEWDKQLRGWLAREIRHWHHGDIAAAKMWSVNFDQIAELLECLGWPVRTTDYFSKLDACRRVVNVYKHGKGDSLDDLKSRYPEYLPDPFEGSGRALSNLEYRDHTHLKVSDDQLQAFSDAIVSFWQNVPESIFDTQVGEVPGWFEKAIQKDQADRKQGGKK